MKKYYLIGILGIIALAAIGIFMYSPESANLIPTSEKTKTPPPGVENTQNSPKGKTPTPQNSTKQNSPAPASPVISKNQGRIIFTLKDEFVSLDKIESILLTVNELQVYSPTKGWITALKGPRAYDLVDIYREGRMEFLSEIALDPGTYNQLRMNVGPVRIINKGSTVAEEAKLPSGELKFPARIQIAKGENSSVEIDMLSEKSLHTASNGKYVFLPVLRIETKANATSFQIRQNMVTIIGGSPIYDATFGMDENGNVKDRYRLSPATKLEIVDDKVRIISN